MRTTTDDPTIDVFANYVIVRGSAWNSSATKEHEEGAAGEGKMTKYQQRRKRRGRFRGLPARLDRVTIK